MSGKRYQQLAPGGMVATSIQANGVYDFGCSVTLFHDQKDCAKACINVKLHSAVLQDAVEILSKYPPPESSSLYVDTLEWLYGECESEPTFSFSEVCSILALSESAVRDGVQRRILAAGVNVEWLRNKVYEMRKASYYVGEGSRKRRHTMLSRYAAEEQSFGVA